METKSIMIKAVNTRVKNPLIEPHKLRKIKNVWLLKNGLLQLMIILMIIS